MSQHQLRVYVAANVDEANIVVAWLAERNIRAIIPDVHTTATLGLPNLIPGSIQVCVADPGQLDEARALLAEQKEALAQHVAGVSESDLIDVVCPNCGETLSVERREAGHVLECPHCHEYVDAPDPTESAE